MRAAASRGLKAYAELTGNKKASQITADDVLGGASVMLSVFINDPQFQGQTKERLNSPEAGRLVEGAVKDHFEHWLTGNPCLLYTSPSPRDATLSRMPSSA